MTPVMFDMSFIANAVVMTDVAFALIAFAAFTIETYVILSYRRNR
jgi:hypothetical protein